MAGSMNGRQRAIFWTAGVNSLIMAMFPPFGASTAMAGAGVVFEGFYPILMYLGRKPISVTVLLMELMFLWAGAMLAWLMSRVSSGGERSALSKMGVPLFATGSLGLVALFPPFESVGLAKASGGDFQGFMFFFTSNSRAVVMTSLLYMETLLILANALAVWMLFSVADKNEDALADPEGFAEIGRGPERRGHELALAPLSEEERRHGGERRKRGWGKHGH